ncbi:uncharacterized protein [Apostichopus japonicus]|uniref:uncharacterized protein n=1 Tax=Stichopus japonicus TaxID=307972 RepID=UPI003AB8C7A2
MSSGCCCFPVPRRRSGRERGSGGLTRMPSNPPTNTTWIPPDPNESTIGNVEDDAFEHFPPTSDHRRSFFRDVTNVDHSRPLNLSATFNLRYCGMLQSVQGLGHSEEDHQDLIMTIGQAQGNGQFKFSDNHNDKVTLHLSKYGIKITDAGIQQHMATRWRHSLLEVIRTVYFVDITRKTYLAIKLGKFGEDIYDSLLFECEKDQAAEICRIMQMLFDAICSPDE